MLVERLTLSLALTNTRIITPNQERATNPFLVELLSHG